MGCPQARWPYAGAMLVGMGALVAVRLAKLAAVMLLAGGTGGALFARDLKVKRRAAFFVAGPGLIVAWMLGYALAFARGTSPISGWILGAMAASTLSFLLVAWSALRDGRSSTGLALGSILALAAALVLMVLRPELGA